MKPGTKVQLFGEWETRRVTCDDPSCPLPHYSWAGRDGGPEPVPLEVEAGDDGAPDVVTALDYGVFHYAADRTGKPGIVIDEPAPEGKVYVKVEGFASPMRADLSDVKAVK